MKTFHLAKRGDITKKKEWLIRAIAILAALILCAIITTIVTGINPIDFYGSIFQGAFGTERKTWITIQNLCVLLIISLALTLSLIHI